MEKLKGGIMMEREPILIVNPESGEKVEVGYVNWSIPMMLIDFNKISIHYPNIDRRKFRE